MFVSIENKWDEYLNQYSDCQKDIYYYERYVKMSSDKDSSPLCIVCRDDNKVLLMPFLRKEIGNYFDFETPYGYGGPIANTDDKQWIKNALNAMIEFFKNNNYLAGFIRFHPILCNADLCRDSFNVIDDRKTVFIDTSVSDDEIWNKQIISKNRNMIRKAEKNGLIYERDNDFKYIEQFKSLYNETMNRLSADEFYYFDDKYFEEFIKFYRGSGFIGCIKNDNKIIGAALFMYNGKYGHYHLAGSKREYASLGVNNLLLWKTSCELRSEGVSFFHLGGGTDSSDENSLYKFKKSFSPNTRQFSIGKIIFNDEAYNVICDDWVRSNPDKAVLYKNHLLKYRY